MATTALPRTLLPLAQKPFFHMSRFGGRRRYYFMPWLVLKTAFGSQRAALASEAANARRAGGNRFWSDLVVGFLRLGPFCLLSRRHRHVAVEDHPALATVLERRLEAALARPRVAGAGLLADNEIHRRLAAADRRRVESLLGGLALPATGMHGDCHMFNFAGSAGGFVLLDWEHYDERGSFVFDYLEFHLANDCFSSGLPWVAFLAGLDGSHPVVSALAARLGVPPEALWLYYLITKLDIKSRRRRSFARMPAARQEIFLRLVRDAVAARPALRAAGALPTIRRPGRA